MHEPELIKTNVLGSRVSHCDYNSAVDLIIRMAKKGEGGIATACNVHMIMVAYRDIIFQKKLNQFNLITPDGQPVRLALNLLGKAALYDRVYGPELMLRLCKRSVDDNTSIFLYGATEETLAKLKTNLEKIKGLRIAGMISPPFRPITDEEKRSYIDIINNSGARICFVGLGCPKQEIWAYENHRKIKAALVCVGAAFDFHAGTIAHAPSWIQKQGLEWLFRLAMEPRRLWSRYLINNPYYVALLFLQWIGVKKFPAPDEAKTQD